MKIIFLNTLDAELREPLAAFITQHKSSTDVFCFQECYERAPSFIAKLLGEDFEAVSARRHLNDFDSFSNMTFVRRKLPIVESGVATEEPSGLGLFVSVVTPRGLVHICNVHGLVCPFPKEDTPGRLAQTRELIETFREKMGTKIIGGDFNLRENSQSVGNFSNAGYRDLIKDLGIKTTRNELSLSLYEHKLYFCDYVFVSEDARVASFVVPAITVSDHLPLILELE
jgi:endonuclease/exonuclease/phosphatase (EEP) superfamily protein YafD